MNNIRNFKFYFKYVLQHKGLYTAFLIILIFNAVLSSLIPFIIGDFINNAQAGDKELIIKNLISIVIILVIDIVFGEFIGFNIAARLYKKIAFDVKLKAFMNLQYMDFSYHTSKSTGKIISKFTKFGSAIFSFLYTFNFFFFITLLSFLIPVILIATISPIITLFMLILFFAAIPLFIVLVKYNFKQREKFNRTDNELTDILADNLIGFETVKSFAKEPAEKKRFEDQLNKTLFYEYKGDFSYRLLFGYARVIGLIELIISTGLALYLFSNKSIEISSLIVIITFSTQIPWKLLDLTFHIREIIKGSSDMDNFIELMELKPNIKNIKNPIIINKNIGKICFKNVSFKYEKNSAIKNLSFEIKPLEQVAFVGKSGAGKTTITKLLLRYYDIDKGKIEIDGIEVRKMKLEQLRNIIGIVPQDPVMFNSTIAYNVGYALDVIDMKIIKEACKIAQIDKFIESLPLKYETIVGERGIKLSGGQRQRLAIARVILKNPKILIFDEATSQLDSESEKLIQKAFSEVAKDKTSIIIAHRLSTIVNSDRIFVLSSGSLYEVGTHEQLLKKKNGIYRHLWDIQSGGFLNL